MNNSTKKQYRNPLEALRELGKETLQTVSEEAVSMPKNIFEQVQGVGIQSGEILPGQSVEVANNNTGESDREQYYKKQLILEKRLRQEDTILVETRTNELRIQIHAIHEEVLKVSEATPRLSKEVEIAAFHAPGDPSSYELYFLERLFEFVRSFRLKIEHAHVWLSASNRRAGKRNVWGANYKKHGAKYLLSGEHYASRSGA